MTYPIAVSLQEKFGTDLSSRSRAAGFRSEILDWIRAGRTQVTIDFDGVYSVSESFADEVFGILVKENGEDWFRQHIVIRSASRDVRDSILLAVQHRLASPQR